NNQIQQVLQVANKVTIMQHNNRIEPLMIKGVNNMNDYQFMIENIVKGRRANADNEILISKYIADKHSIDTADRILFYFTDQPVKLRKYKVVGVYESSIDEIDQNIVLANIDLVKSVNDWTNNQIAYYQIHLKDRTKLNEELLVQLDQYIPLDQKVFTNQEIYSELYDWINLLDVNSQVIIILMLIVAGINMISAILILILERVAFIGVLKTMGASNAFVKRVFYYNASYLIFIGLLIGNSLTLITYYLQKKFHLIELDPSSYYMKYVEIHFKPLDFVLMNTGVFISTLFFVWLGTLLITKINPLKAIRFN
ncbi:MAG: ABC transporter permease, partial [bacterium]